MESARLTVEHHQESEENVEWSRSKRADQREQEENKREHENSNWDKRQYNDRLHGFFKKLHFKLKNGILILFWMKDWIHTLIAYEKWAVPPPAARERLNGSVESFGHKRPDRVDRRLKEIDGAASLKYAVVETGRVSVDNHVAGEERYGLCAYGR